MTNTATESLRKSLDLFRQTPTKHEFVSRFLEPLLAHSGQGVVSCHLTEDTRQVRVLFDNGQSVSVNVAGDNLWGIACDVVHALERD